jgi:ubiquinone/menaquinone biosynthesis C-methylase UbiE
MAQKSYTSQRSGPIALLQEARHLYEAHTIDVAGRVAEIVARLEEMRAVVFEYCGLDLNALDMLDVGAGQRLLQMVYFSKSNSVVGIDRDVIAQGWDPRGYFEMFRSNGVRRTVKTVVRKMLGIDRKHRIELMRQAEVQKLGQLLVFQMDAANMTFRDESFDFVYSTAVFQHLQDPARVVREIVRVLRPGGAFYIDFLPYTSRGGSLDIRSIGGRGSDIPPWAHLRPQFKDTVQESGYLNQLTLSEWLRVFEARAPGCHIIRRKRNAELLEKEIRDLWAQGELVEYNLDDLVTAEVVAIWRKPTREG